MAEPTSNPVLRVSAHHDQPVSVLSFSCLSMSKLERVCRTEEGRMRSIPVESRDSLVLSSNQGHLGVCFYPSPPSLLRVGYCILSSTRDVLEIQSRRTSRTRFQGTYVLWSLKVAKRETSIRFLFQMARHFPVSIADGSPFGLHNLPFGIFSPASGNQARVSPA